MSRVSMRTQRAWLCACSRGIVLCVPIISSNPRLNPRCSARRKARWCDDINARARARVFENIENTIFLKKKKHGRLFLRFSAYASFVVGSATEVRSKRISSSRRFLFLTRTSCRSTSDSQHARTYIQLSSPPLKLEHLCRFDLWVVRNFCFNTRRYSILNVEAKVRFAEATEGGEYRRISRHLTREISPREIRVGMGDN